MGCLKLNIRDYFTLRTSQKSDIPCLDSTNQKPIHTAKHSESYTYDSIIEEKTITKTDIQLLICIQNIPKMLFLFCDLRTNTPTFTLTTYTYDALQDDSTTKNRKNDTSIRRKTSMGKSGTAFDINGTPSPDTISYGYDDKSEVTSASSANNSTYDFGYNFDQIGNREDYTTNESGSPVQSLYTTNNLNQYTNITNPSQAPTHDDDGNMLTLKLESGDWTNTYNAENRIIVAESATAKLEMVYDYMGRRVSKKVYSGSTGNWTLDKHLKLVYDGFQQIEELDGDNANAILKKRIWSGGKIICDIRNNVAYYALGDANKNITEYIDASGTIQGHYEYSPFGKITASSGAMKDDFDYRFSSEVFDTETSLSYYNYRYYSPELGRWLNRDPIEESGGNNLYGFVGNQVVNAWDLNGYGLGKKCIDAYCSATETSIPTDFSKSGISEFLLGSLVSLPSTSVIGNLLSPTTMGDGEIHYKAIWKNLFVLSKIEINITKKIDSSSFQNKEIQNMIGTACDPEGLIKQKTMAIVTIDVSLINLKTFFWEPSPQPPMFKQRRLFFGMVNLEEYIVDMKCTSCCKKNSTEKELIWAIGKQTLTKKTSIGTADSVFSYKGRRIFGLKKY